MPVYVICRGWYIAGINYSIQSITFIFLLLAAYVVFLGDYIESKKRLLLPNMLFAADYADTVVYGTIRTAEADNPIAEAIAENKTRSCSKMIILLQLPFEALEK